MVRAWPSFLCARGSGVRAWERQDGKAFGSRAWEGTWKQLCQECGQKGCIDGKGMEDKEALLNLVPVAAPSQGWHGHGMDTPNTLDLPVQIPQYKEGSACQMHASLYAQDTHPPAHRMMEGALGSSQLHAGLLHTLP